MSNGAEIYSKLGLNAERVAGYVYSGLYMSFIAALIIPSEVKKIVEALGGLLTAMSVIAMGFGVYIFYRYLVGEFLLYPIQHQIHILLDRALKRKNERATSTITFIKSLGVPYGARRDAYSALRDAFFPSAIKGRLDLVHGELHALYISSIGSFVVYFFSGIVPNKIEKVPWLILGCVTWIAAIIADTHQHIVETRILRSCELQEVTDFLRKEGHILSSLSE